MKPDPVLADSPSSSSNASSGRLLAWLVAGFYALFTLLPDSSSLMVAWPWVFIWQVGLTCSVLWLLWMVWQERRLQGLGHGLDWITALTLLGLLISTVLAEFPAQARWYGWATLCFLAALYALTYWLQASAKRRYQLLVGQGYLSLAFILVSLLLWTSQTFLPELARLQDLRQYGINLSFNFVELEVRNWAPIGHQNYVAGYLVLALPLLIGLTVLHKGWQRWLWGAGVALGLVNLYTTSSRGGWLSLAVLAIAALFTLVFTKSIPQRWRLWGGGGILVALSAIVLLNPRFRGLSTAILRGQAGGDAFRLITTTAGWEMGLSHLWSGVGPGGVPLLYQQYRPDWAGREAELVYQLHNTPMQLWAELGIWGVISGLGAIALLAYLGVRWLQTTTANSHLLASQDQIFTWSLYGGLLAYGVMSLTDYQLDVVPISGTLIIFLAVLASQFRQVLTSDSTQTVVEHPTHPKASQIATWAGVGLVLAASIWLVPVHYAWNLSSQGFIALSQQNVNGFVERLSQAHRFAPWEPYYLYQLGWNLGNLSLQASERSQQQELQKSSISWFQAGNAASPNQEFGHTNLGWLLLNQDPQAATQEFARSAQLVPAKRGVFYGLGLSLLAQGKTDLAVEAITLEALRDPPFITSPIWRDPQLQPVYTQVLQRLEGRYTKLLQTYAEPGPLNTYLHQNRGGLRWWQGNLTAAREDLSSFGTPLSQLILDLAEGKLVTTQQLGNSAGELAIAAWLTPTQRSTLLQQAWIQSAKQPPPAELLQEFINGMANSTTFDQWLKQNAPIQQYRRERAGFGVLSRHVDGPAPTDFLTVVENVAMTALFDQLFPFLVYEPALDSTIQAWHTTLLQQV